MGQLRFLVMLAFASSAFSIASAQGGMGMGIDMGKIMNAPVMLVIQQDFKKDLKLDKDQDKKITAICSEYQKSMKAGGTDPNNPMAAMNAMNEQTDKANSAIIAELRPEQVTRLRQLQWQCAGAKALYEEDLQKALELSPEVVAKLKERKDSHATRLMAAMQGGPKKLAEVNKQDKAYIEGLLSAEQMTKLKELLGPVNNTAKRMGDNSVY